MANEKIMSPDTINYKQWFNRDLLPLMSQVTRWLRKNEDIHICDIVISGAATYDDDWQAIIYYFTKEEKKAWYIKAQTPEGRRYQRERRAIL